MFPIRALYHLLEQLNKAQSFYSLNKVKRQPERKKQRTTFIYST